MLNVEEVNYFVKNIFKKCTENKSYLYNGGYAVFALYGSAVSMKDIFMFVIITSWGLKQIQADVCIPSCFI